MAAKPAKPVKRLNLSFEQHELILDLLELNLPENPLDDSFELFYTTLLKVRKAPTYQTQARKTRKPGKNSKPVQHGQYVVKDPE